jgi:REP element-mobilizing transposase RayT
VLGRIVGGEFKPTKAGEAVRSCWEGIPDHHALVRLDEYVIMPNHVHGVIVLEWYAAGDAGVAPTTARGAEVHPSTSLAGPKADSVSAIVGSFKASVSRRLSWKKMHSHPIWQRGFYDHVIRTDEALHAIREYIRGNVLSWELDELNSQRIGKSSFYNWLGSQ